MRWRMSIKTLLLLALETPTAFVMYPHLYTVPIYRWMDVPVWITPSMATGIIDFVKEEEYPGEWTARFA